MVSLPNLIGKTKTEAMKVLSESGILFRIETEQTKETTPGNVLRMDPAPGTQVKAGSSENTVTIVVSREEIERYQIPSFVGKLIDDVEKMLSDSEQNPQNFRIGTVTEQDDTSPKGTILSQTPTEGTEAIKGSAINVVVSSGADCFGRRRNSYLPHNSRSGGQLADSVYRHRRESSAFARTDGRPYSQCELWPGRRRHYNRADYGFNAHSAAGRVYSDHRSGADTTAGRTDEHSAIIAVCRN